MIRLDLGSGSRPRDGFLGVDIAELPGVKTFDLVSGSRWPWADGSVDELCSSHFIEHIPADTVEIMHPNPSAPYITRRVAQDRLLFFFDEAYRVIRPGGLFHLVWPSLKSTDAFRDPTHRRFLPLEFTHYLSREARETMGVSHYVASCNWVVVEGGVNLHTEPRAEGAEPFTEFDLHRVWDTQRAWSVTLCADK